MSIIYLTGTSNEITRAVNRPDLGLLGTPAGSTWRQRDSYPCWAADNGCFVAPLPDPTLFPHAPLGAPAFDTPTSRAVRYGPEPQLVARWFEWIRECGSGCLFATLPDVVGDYAATWERSSQYIARLRAAKIPIAIVLQDGVERDNFVWGSILIAADAVFIGGSTEWKLGPAVPALVAEAKERGLWVHMGRVNSFKRLSYAAEIGCDSADGTYLNFGRKADRLVNTHRLFGWLNTINGAPEERVHAA